MRLLKLAIISLVVLFLLITGISLFIPSHVKISRAINLKADRSAIMSRIKDASAWDQWYPGTDSASVPLYDTENGGKIIGVVFNGRDTAHQHFMIITKVDSSEVSAQLITEKLKPVINVWQVVSYTYSDSLTLHWYMDFHLRWYPWEKFASLLLERSYGPAMEQGLARLKRLVEN